MARHLGCWQRHCDLHLRNASFASFFFFSASSLDLACCSFLSSISFSMSRTFCFHWTMYLSVLCVFLWELRLHFSATILDAPCHSSIQLLSFGICSPFYNCSFNLSWGIWCRRMALLDTHQELKFHFLLITGMKNISFRVSTDKFIAQNIIIQLDHSLGRETNQKYSYLPVFLMKFTNFIKFEKQHCGFWGACSVGFVVL